ncbi:hypothetical protein PIB30_027054 [Stylosanthes scabra]|uniref:Uncharacterized protein n=1 Tax=Stylosanthes scabra TaxID=79078 RepID=A0ABU6SBC6_9FABA|nr:hypothetical protein [Stylosanthes scabra]
MLTWFIITGGINTKDALSRRNIIPQGEDKCVLCNDAPKSVVTASRCGLNHGWHKRFIVGRKEVG